MKITFFAVENLETGEVGSILGTADVGDSDVADLPKMSGAEKDAVIRAAAPLAQKFGSTVRILPAGKASW